MDIGSGTQDILLYDDSKNIENCIKMVLPSPSSVYATKVIEASKLMKNLLIYGDIIGGGKFTSAIKDHLKKGLHVHMSESAAYSIRNILSEVTRYGIEIIDHGVIPESFDGEILSIKEVDIQYLKKFLLNSNEDLSDVDIVAIAVQDHGVPHKGMSNRRFRTEIMRERLRKNPKLYNLAFTEDCVPNDFLRMNSAVKASKRDLPRASVLVMDTSLAALLGCFWDPVVKTTESILAINFGNEHILASILVGRDVIGMMEHHTGLLKEKELTCLLNRFIDGKLTDEEVFNNGGHGAFYTSKPQEVKIDAIVVTGPNREIIKNTRLDTYFATPAGDMMMTGPIGLIEASRYRFS